MYSEEYLKHCNLSIMPYEIWFLQDIEGFNDRKLKLAKCPKCRCDVVELSERRIIDNKLFTNTFSKAEALHVIELNKGKVNYSSLEVQSRKIADGEKMPRTLRYGVNKDIKGRTKEDRGKIIGFKQIAVDYYGNKDTIRKKFF